MHSKVFGLALILSPLFAAAANADDTEWNHNGSVMMLESNGKSRNFVYLKPRPGIPVKPGDVLFMGERKGSTYKGTAYTFSSRCGPLSYSVEGPVSSDQRSVTLQGARPNRGATCDDITYVPETMEFTFIDPNVSAPSVDSSSSNPLSQAGPRSALSSSAPRSAPAPSTAPEPRSLSRVGLPYIDTKLHPSSDSDASVAYNACAKLWNEEDYSVRAYAKALVVGQHDGTDVIHFVCYSRSNKSLPYTAENHRKMYEIGMKNCNAEQTTCYTFAIGDQMSDWALAQRNAYSKLPSARP